MKASDWISVKDRLPDVDTMVLIYTTNNKCGISSMYIPKDCYGKVLGEKEWRGCGAMKNAITHWQPIVLPQQEEVMNDKQKVCVVHIETRRFFDDCQNSYLPVMYPIFGVFSTRETAERAVWDYFTNRFKEQYEVCCDNFDAEGNGLDFDLCFKREDKVFKGHALYGVDFYLETIDL